MDLEQERKCIFEKQHVTTVKNIDVCYSIHPQKYLDTSNLLVCAAGRGKEVVAKKA